LYFGDRPKVRGEDFYDREDELRKLVDSLRKGSALTVVKGLRRLGKSSLMLIGLSKLGSPHLLIDCRQFEEVAHLPRRALIGALEESVNSFIREHRSLWSALKEHLSRVRGVKVGDFSVTFSWSTQRALSLTGLFDTLNRFAEDRGIKVVVAVDEAQQLRKLANFDFSGLLAHIYDYDGNLQLLLTGSQVGLLDDLLGVDDPSSPLYGRARSEILLGRFSVEQSAEFLREGFKQCRMRVSDETIEYAVEKLDGIVGWLSNFGWQCYLKGEASKGLVDELMKEAAGLALREFENFLKRRPASERYLTIMKRVAREPARWAGIKAHLESESGARIYDANLAGLLGELLKAGFLEVKDGVYEVADPVLRYALCR
jgi:AAA+ ATPase superfamily predicted ATPase